MNYEFVIQYRPKYKIYMGKAQIKIALNLAGSWHKYQLFLIALLAFAWISMMLVILSSPFLYMDPIFRCESIKEKLVLQKQACPIINQCQLVLIVDDFTMTHYLNLYCDQESIRVILQAMFPFGSFVGLMVMNPISDTKGRRKAFLISLGINLTGILLLLIVSHNKNTTLLMISQFLRGFGAQSIMPLCYTLCADFLSDRVRPKAIVILNTCGGLVTIMLGFLYIIKLNWFYFLIFFQLVPFIIASVVFYRYLQQSPFILMQQNKKAEARQVLLYIAHFNHQQQNAEQIVRLLDIQEQVQEQKTSVQNVYKKIKQWKYLKTILILILVNGIADTNNFGITYSFSQVGLGYGYDSMMFGFVQIFSLILVNYVVSNMPRRLGISMFYMLTMIIWLMYFTGFVQNSMILSTVLIGISGIFSISANCLIGCVETQAFSSQIQSTSIGLIQGFSLYGAIIAPIIVDAAQQNGYQPMSLIALIVAFAIWPPYFLKQTFHKKYQDQTGQTVHQLKQNDKSKTQI